MSNLIVEAYKSLAAPINKVLGRDGADTQEGIVGEQLPELTLDMSNEDILALTTKFEKAWTTSPVYSEWTKQGKENHEYWKGKQYQGPQANKLRPLMDNVIFESVETALPQFISHNPDPEVDLYPGMTVDSIATQYITEVQEDLGQLADELRLRLKMKKVARHWATSLLGVAKFGWNVNKNIPTMKVVRPQKIILDPDAVVDEDGYTGDRIGEYRELTAGQILKVPGLEKEAEAAIKTLVKENLGTKVAFIEWWTNDYMCWTLAGKTVLLKKKNPHWNYDQQIPLPNIDDVDMGQGPISAAPAGAPPIPQLPMAAPSAAGPAMPSSAPLPTPPTGPTPLPAMPAGMTPPTGAAPAAAPTEAPNPPQMPEVAGEEPEQDTQLPAFTTKEGVNHFAAAKMPYLFLVMFNLDDRPVDETSLIGQNLANQDVINKRIKQIDKNADNMNGGLVVSGERSGLTKDQSKGVSAAIRAGGVVFIPAGDPRAAVYRPDTPGLPADVYNQAADLRQRVRGIFGTAGSSAPAIQADPTVRGKIMANQMDTSRIGGGIGEILEQFADDAYNWFYQLKLVYDDRYIAMAEQGLLPKVRISVKPGSLLPKDKTTMASQAMQLAAQGSMSHLDLFIALELPNPEKLAANAWLEKNAPDVLYKDDPRVAQVMQRMQAQAQAAEQAKAQAAQKPPVVSESIAFKDLPPDGKVQMAAKVGIQLHSEGIAAHEQLTAGKDGKLPEPVAPATP